MEAVTGATSIDELSTRISALIAEGWDQNDNGHRDNPGGLHDFQSSRASIALVVRRVAILGNNQHNPMDY